MAWFDGSRRSALSNTIADVHRLLPAAAKGVRVNFFYTAAGRFK
jgi:hypothetical protein